MNKPVNCRCGGKVKIETDHDTLVPGEPIDWKRVRCSECNIRTTWRHTEAEAIEAWNRAMGGKTVKVENYQDPFGLGGYGDCSECGAEVNEQYAYCPNCGARLEWK